MYTLYDPLFIHLLYSSHTSLTPLTLCTQSPSHSHSPLYLSSDGDWITLSSAHDFAELLDSTSDTIRLV
jgi:hypothetical protein